MWNEREGRDPARSPRRERAPQAPRGAEHDAGRTPERASEQAPERTPTARGADERYVVRLDSDELARGPWVFGRQVEPPAELIPGGELVEVYDRSDRFLGHALCNEASDIRLRWLSRGRKTDLDRPREFLERTLRAADRLRRKTLRLHERTNAYRVAHAEGDDLPGLIVDRLNDVLVCEHHALGFWRLRDDVEAALRAIYPECGVVHRIPASARRSEGFSDRDLALSDHDTRGRETQIEENGVRYPVAPGLGHKTGWFCDQRDNRALVASYCAGRDVLDLCCNAGGFALNAAKAGARSVHAVDLDEVVLERAVAAARLNGLRIEFTHADAFDVLRATATSATKPSVLVVDPHKVIATKNDYEAGLLKYSDLNTLAFKAVREGGLVATFSCSGLLQEPAFFGMLFQSARRAGRNVRLLTVLGAGPDHPQRPDFSRSRYLKGALLAVD
jgi:23S rRNA (cytosine1962-C5)-methyltransferase